MNTVGTSMRAASRHRKINDFFNNDYQWWENVYDDGLPRGFFSYEMIRRKEILLELLNDMAGEKTSVDILECGCGPGGLLCGINFTGNRLTGVDINFDYLAKAKNILGERASLSAADVEQLPFRNDSFDIVYCVGVLSYLEQDGKAVAEIARVTKPGGRIIISLPNLFTLGKLLDPYYYVAGPIIIGWRRVKRRWLERSTAETGYRTSMIRRYRFGQLDRLYRESGLKKGETYGVSFGPPTLCRKEILPCRQAVRLSGFLAKISERRGGVFLRRFSNHWVTCLEKPAVREGL